MSIGKNLRPRIGDTITWLIGATDSGRADVIELRRNVVIVDAPYGKEIPRHAILTRMRALLARVRP